MRATARTAATLALAAAATGCLGTTSAAREDAEEGAGNGIVIDAEQLHGRGGSLLQAIRVNASMLRVRPGSPCPEIVMRGKNSLNGTDAPTIYVDDQRATDTCVLEMINPENVQRVEVYPMGVSGRPGVFSHGGGLILVFMRGATDAE